MPVKQKRLLINTAAIAMLASAVAVGVWAFSPVDSPMTQRQTNSGASANVAKETDGAVAFVVDDHWNRKLRRPIVDPPKPKPKPRPLVIKPLPKQPAGVPKKIDLNIVLVGTILESGGGVGVFSDASGRFDSKPVDGVLSLEPKGIRVDKLGPNQATVSLNGRKTQLEIKTTKAKKNKANKRKRLK